MTNDHTIDLLTYLADREALIRLSDGEVKTLEAALKEAAWAAGEDLEDAEVLLGAIQRGQELLSNLRQFRQKFTGPSEATTSERTTTMIGKSENKAMEAPAPRTPVEELAELTAEAQRLAALHGQAVHERNLIEFGSGAEAVKLRRSPDAAAYQARMTILKDAEEEAQRLADRARREVLNFQKAHAGKMKPYDPRNPMERARDEAEAREDARFNERARRLGYVPAGGAR